MPKKYIVLDDETRRLFNKAKGVILLSDTSGQFIYDNSVINIVLKHYLGDKDKSKRRRNIKTS